MKPVVIVGGGVAALGAALVLKHAAHPFLILEAHDRLGGRMASMKGDGWIADTGCPYFSLRDTSLVKLVREVGMDVETTVLMGAVARLSEQGQIESDAGDFGGNRVSLRRGMESLFDAWLRELTVIFDTPVGALRWDDQQRVFFLRDNHTARAVRHPIHNNVIEAGGVVLAVPGTAAHPIVRSTRVLSPLEPYTDKIAYGERIVGIFRVPRHDAGCAVLLGNAGTGFDWICFEERKHPDRVAKEWSIITAWASSELMERRKVRYELGALEELYAAVRAVLKELPEGPLEQHLVRWSSAFPRPGTILSVPEEGVPTDPPDLPVAIAGDYTAGDSADAAAESGMRAAWQVLARLG